MTEHHPHTHSNLVWETIGSGLRKPGWGADRLPRFGGGTVCLGKIDNPGGSGTIFDFLRKFNVCDHALDRGLVPSSAAPILKFG